MSEIMKLNQVRIHYINSLSKASRARMTGNRLNSLPYRTPTSNSTNSISRLPVKPKWSPIVCVGLKVVPFPNVAENY
jgi:hypothetical protein